MICFVKGFWTMGYELFNRPVIESFSRMMGRMSSWLLIFWWSTFVVSVPKITTRRIVITMMMVKELDVLLCGAQK